MQELERVEAGAGAQPHKTPASWWDALKCRVVTVCTETAKECKAKVTTSYRQRLKRLGAQYKVAISSGDAKAAGAAQARLAEVKLDWARSKARRLRLRYSLPPAARGKKFYRRIATKYSDNTIVALGPGTGGSSSRQLANIMAGGWAPIMEQQQTNTTGVSEYFDAGPCGNRVDLEALASPILIEEVQLAVKRCKRGKAQGPDRLPNDLYRDHAERLAPLPTRLFNSWLAAGTVPASCLQANIHCIKKSATASLPLEHRPIALLNTDYKVYTSVFAHRLRDLVPELIHKNQAGFVLSRSVHTTNDILLASQRIADQAVASSTAVCILLDIAKAYDSLN